MRKIITTLACIVIATVVMAQIKAINIWYTPVQKPSYVWDEYYYYFAPKDLAEDLAGLLESSTGISFIAKPYDEKSKTGIFLLLDSTKKNLTNEAATVNCDGISYLKITGRFATGLSYALYTYLEKAGFKFYLPGKKWTIVPVLTNVYINKINNEEWKPYFKVRSFFISAAMHWIKDIDPEKNNLKEWNTWYRRNRMGSEYTILGGHVGEAFNAYHQKEIEQDSMILAPVDGKRKYDAFGKLDPTYAKGVNMFIDWAARQYKTYNKIVPSYIPYQTYQSVDPGDGLSYCHSPECEKKFKSVSDQVFTVANKAALRLKNLYPSAGVSLYAYSERADTPAVKIENNVHVCIVATAFQDIGTAPALIKRWAKKTKHISIYDYLNIGVWNREHPFFNLKNYFQYLDFVKQQQAEGFVYEAGGSAMASGLIQYFILKYLCNPYADVQKEFDLFCHNVFGNAAPPVKKMMQEWFFCNDKIGTRYEVVTFNETELGRFVNYIQEAASANGLTPEQKYRIFELKAYVVYLVKYFELKADVGTLYLNKGNLQYVKNKTDEILSYLWMLYPTLIFHNTHINDVLKYEMADEAFTKKWDYFYSDNFKNITLNAEKKVNEAFAVAHKKYSPQANPLYTDIQGLLKKAYLYRTDTIRVNMIDAAAFANYLYSFNVYCAAPTTITIFYKAKPEKPLEGKINNIGLIGLIKDDYSVHSEQLIYPDKMNGSITLSLPKAGHYKVSLAQHNAVGYTYTIIPRNTLFYINNSVIPANGLQVMDNVDGKDDTNKQLAFYTASADSLNYSMIYADRGNYIQIYNNKGQKKLLEADNQPGHMALKLREDEKNTFMYFTTNVYRWPPQFKTTPPYYFYLKFPLNARK
jgi:Domain of unknown function (DUF4838)